MTDIPDDVDLPKQSQETGSPVDKPLNRPLISKSDWREAKHLNKTTPSNAVLEQFGDPVSIVGDNGKDIFLAQLDGKAKKASDTKSPADLVTKAKESLRVYGPGQIYGAIDLTNQAIKLDAKNVDAYLTRAIAKSALGDFKGALADCTQAITIQPNNADAYAERASQHNQLGDGESALRDLNQAIKLSPANTTFRASRGDVKAKLGRTQEAIEEYSEALKLEPKDPDLLANSGWRHVQLAISQNKLGNNAEAKKQYEQAVADITKAIDIKRTGDNEGRPSISEDLNNRGMAYAGLGRFAEAEKDYNECLAKDSTSDRSEIHTNRAELYEKRNASGDAEVARKERQEAAKWKEISAEVEKDKKDFNDRVIDLISKGKIPGGRIDRPALASFFIHDGDAAEFVRYATEKLKSKNLQLDFSTVSKSTNPDTPDNRDRILRITDNKGQPIDEIRFDVAR